MLRKYFYLLVFKTNQSVSYSVTLKSLTNKCCKTSTTFLTVVMLQAFTSKKICKISHQHARVIVPKRDFLQQRQTFSHSI